jgi:hypothetical protein
LYELLANECFATLATLLQPYDIISKQASPLSMIVYIQLPPGEVLAASAVLFGRLGLLWWQ